MALTELLIRVRVEALTDPVGQFHDGMVVQARHPGVLIPTTEIQQFIANGTVPPSAANVSPVKRREVRGLIRRARYFIDHTVAEIVQVSGQTTAWATDEKTNAGLFRDRILASGGYDTTWRFGELSLFAIAAADLDHDEVSEALELDWDDTLPDNEIVNSNHDVRRRRLRVPYFNLAPAALVARWRDPTDIVHVNRVAAPLTFSDLEVIP